MGVGKGFFSTPLLPARKIRRCNCWV